jgi:Transcriptional regulators containing a DNA-binding HTH domain and an aminotransferase domain (MocR family) and their eukaryotic orthologs
MVLPEKLVNRFYSIFENFPSSVPFIIQKTLQHFMEEGYWDSYIRKTIRDQKRKHDALVHTLDKEFGDKITILAKNAGLHIVVQVKWNMKEDELIKRAYKAGVKVYPTSVLWDCKKSHEHGAVMMGFGAIQIEHIPKAVKLLKKAWLA